MSHARASSIELDHGLKAQLERALVLSLNTNLKPVACKHRLYIDSMNKQKSPKSP